jgi:hypothetical protein
MTIHARLRHSPQAPAAVVMVRPHAFRSNPDTLGDNAFQQGGVTTSTAAVSGAAYREVSTMAAHAGLRCHGAPV